MAEPPVPARREGLGSSEEATADPHRTHPPHGIRHMLGAYEVTRDRLYGHVKKRKTRVEFLAFCRYVRCTRPR